MTGPLAELERAYTAVVADALDQLGMRNQALDPAIRPLFPGARVAGYALPVSIVASGIFPDPPYEQWIRMAEAVKPDNVVMLAVELGVVAATWGELFSCAVRGQAGRGAISDGLIRDAQQIEELAFPVFARGSTPIDTLGRAEVASIGAAVQCGGVGVESGDFVLADGDGVVCVPAGIINEVLAIVREKASKETNGREDLLAGAGVREVWDRYGVF